MLYLTILKFETRKRKFDCFLGVWRLYCEVNPQLGNVCNHVLCLVMASVPGEEADTQREVERWVHLQDLVPSHPLA